MDPSLGILPRKQALLGCGLVQEKNDVAEGYDVGIHDHEPLWRLVRYSSLPILPIFKFSSAQPTFVKASQVFVTTDLYYTLFFN